VVGLGVLEEVLREARERLVYSEEEYAEIEEEARRIAGKTGEAIEGLGVKARVLIAGSLAKRTMVRGFGDVDIFILLDPSYPKSRLGELVRSLGDEVFGRDRYGMRYADHPYIEAEIGGVTYSIVPAYDVKPGSWISPVDRTPYHLEYVMDKIRGSPGLRDDIVLLKAFMRRIGVYGAEVYVKGFSGYLCELLTIHYGSLKKLLEAAATWRIPVVIDIEGHYRYREDILRIFKDPMIVVDPVDKSRNAASAVSPRSLSTFMSAAKFFLKKPSIEFFNVLSPREAKPMEIPEGLHIVAVLISHKPEPPDIIYSRVERVARRILRQLELMGFEVYRWEVYSDFERLSALIMATPAIRIPRVRVRLGPAPHIGDEEAFTAKNRGKYIWIDWDGRWRVVEERAEHDITEAIRRVIDSLSLPEVFSREEIRVLVDDEVGREVPDWLREFTSRREFWVDM
jgi:tRNA nucleotidyltransferase (CCA-adding enzyme)